MKPRLSSKLPSPGRLIIGQRCPSSTSLRRAPIILRSIADPNLPNNLTTPIARRLARKDGRNPLWQLALTSQKSFSLSSGRLISSFRSVVKNC